MPHSPLPLTNHNHYSPYHPNTPPSPSASTNSSSSRHHSLHHDNNPAACNILNDSMRELRELLCNVESDENYRSMIKKSTRNRNTVINLARSSNAFKTDRTDSTPLDNANYAGTAVNENMENENAFGIQQQNGLNSQTRSNVATSNQKVPFKSQPRSTLRNGRRAKPPPLNLDGISNVNTQKLNAALKKNEPQNKNFVSDIPASYPKSPLNSPPPNRNALSPTDGILDYYINCDNYGTGGPRRKADQRHCSTPGVPEDVKEMKNVIRRSKSLVKDSNVTPRLEKSSSSMTASDTFNRPARSAGFRHASSPVPQIHGARLNATSPPNMSDIVQYERLAGIYGWETSSLDFYPDNDANSEDWEEPKHFYQESMVGLPTDSGIEEGHINENGSIHSTPSKPGSDFRIGFAEKDRRRDITVKGTVKKALSNWFGGSAKQKYPRFPSSGGLSTTTTSIAITKRKISISIPQFDPPTAEEANHIPPVPPLKGIGLSDTTVTRIVAKQDQLSIHRQIGNAAEMLPPPPRGPPPTTMLQTPPLVRNRNMGRNGNGNGWSPITSPENGIGLNKQSLISLSTSFSGSESEMDSHLTGYETDGMLVDDVNLSAKQKGNPIPYHRRTDDEKGQDRRYFTRESNGILDKRDAPQQQVDSGFLSTKEMAIATEKFAADYASGKDTLNVGENAQQTQAGASTAGIHNNNNTIHDSHWHDGSNSNETSQTFSDNNFRGANVVPSIFTEVETVDESASSAHPMRNLQSQPSQRKRTETSASDLSAIFLASPYVLPELPFITRPSSGFKIPGITVDEDDEERNKDNEVREKAEVEYTSVNPINTSLGTGNEKNTDKSSYAAREKASAKADSTAGPTVFPKRDNIIRPETDKSRHAPIHYPMSPANPSPAMAPTMLHQSQSLSLRIFDVLASESSNFILYPDEKENERRTETAVANGSKEGEGKDKGSVSAAPNIIMAGTVEKLVERLTILVDYTFLTDFFFTYRSFISPVQLCKLLILRFRWALSGPDPLKDELRSLVRIRTFVTFRHWISLYYVYDFLASRTLRFTLATFLNDVRFHPVVKASPRDARIVRGLRGMVKRLRRTYQRQNDSNSIRTALGAGLGETPDVLPGTGTEENDVMNENTIITNRPVVREQTNMDSPKFGGQYDPAQNEKRSISEPALGRATSGNGNNREAGLNAAQRVPSYNQLSLRNGGTGTDASSIRDANAWTLKMTFGLANLRKKNPKVYNSLVTGMGGLGTELAECTCSAAKTGYGDLQERTVMNPSEREDARNNGSLSDVPSSDQHHRRESLLKKQHDPTCAMFRFTSENSLSVENKLPSSNSVQSLSQLSQNSSLFPRFFSDASPTPALNGNMNPFHLPSFLHQHASSSAGTPYRSFILDHRSELIARQFCIIEQRNLRGIHWDELVEVTWTKCGQKKSERKRKFGRHGDHSMDRNSTLEGDVSGEGSGVMALIDRFNLTCQWVTSEVISTQSLDDRVKVIEKFIRIGLKCLHHNNFSTLTQLLLGLQSPSISRLRKTWSRVGSYELRVLRDLQEFTSPFKNWKNIRDAMRRAGNSLGYSPDTDAVERAAARARRGPTSNQSVDDEFHSNSFSFRGGRSGFGGSNFTSPRTSISRPGRKTSFTQNSHTTSSSNSLLPNAGTNASTGCIPFLGLYLSDLVFNAELPSLLDPPVDSESAPLPPNHFFQNENSKFRVSLVSYSPGDELPPQRLVNFHKYRTIATIIKSVLAFQALSRRYNFEADVSVYPRCVFLRCLDNVEARRLSHECES